MSEVSSAVHSDPAGMFAATAVQGRSGVVTAQIGRLKRLFCLERGELIFAASNIIEEQFDEFLVQRKVLTPGQRAVTKLEASRAERKFASYLDQQRVVDPGLLRRGLEDYVRKLLFETLDAPDVELEFAPGKAQLDGELRVKLSCIPLILGYAEHHPESLDEVRIRIGPPSMRPVLAPAAPRLLEGVALPSSATYLLEQADGERDLSELLAGAKTPGGETLRRLYGLLLLGLLRPAVVEAPRSTLAREKASREETVARVDRAREADHYAILGVGHNATEDEVREAYYVLARRFHPDRFRTGELTDLLGQVEQYFTQVTEAYNTLFHAELRERYDEELAALSGTQAKKDPEQDRGYLARQNFTRARALLDKNRYQEAVTFLENAVQLDSGQASYALELGRVLARNPRQRPEAERHLLRAIELDPASAAGYLAVAQLYVKMDDRVDDAVSNFREALRWDPGNAEARKALEELGHPPDGDDGGFGGLFRG